MEGNSDLGEEERKTVVFWVMEGAKRKREGE
jgi:hypothetical protein